MKSVVCARPCIFFNPIKRFIIKLEKIICPKNYKTQTQLCIALVVTAINTMG